MEIFIFLWFAFCPICKAEFEVERRSSWNSYSPDGYEDAINLEPCPTCSVVIAARLRQASQIESTIVPNDGGRGNLTVRVATGRRILWTREKK